MTQLAEKQGSSLKVAKVTSAGTAAVVIVALQFVVMSAITDLLMSAVLFGVGYVAGRFGRAPS